VACDNLIAVLDACGLERVTLVGHDWGAVVAHVCAALRPDRVGRLVFVDGPVLGTDPGSRPSFWHMAFLAELDLPETLIAGREAAFVRAFMFDYAERHYALREEDMAAYSCHLAGPGGLRSALAWYREAPAGDFAWLQANALPKLAMRCWRSAARARGVTGRAR
jgi:pimeloyl-ACP methyl ester carboxylesterase